MISPTKIPYRSTGSKTFPNSIRNDSEPNVMINEGNDDEYEVIYYDGRFHSCQQNLSSPLVEIVSALNGTKQTARKQSRLFATTPVMMRSPQTLLFSNSPPTQHGSKV